MERKYSVAEIDALRKVVEQKWLWGRYSGPPRFPRNVTPQTPYTDKFGNSYGSPIEVPWGVSSRVYKETEKTAAVEQLVVRTHMLAGHTAEDLLASEQPAAA